VRQLSLLQAELAEARLANARLRQQADEEHARLAGGGCVWARVLSARSHHLARGHLTACPCTVATRAPRTLTMPRGVPCGQAPGGGSAPALRA
jgi:hypothetical protein